MSAKIHVKTKLKDQDTLLEALRLMGIPDSAVAVDPAGVPIRGYRGADWGKAPIVVSRDAIGGYADIGFQNVSGHYEVAIDHYDTFSASEKYGGSDKQEFPDLVSQWYAAAISQRTLRNQGFDTTIRRDGDRLKVLATARY